MTGRAITLLPAPLRGRNRSALFWNLLPNPLMRPCLVEVGHIRLEDALELLLLKDQQMIEAFLPDAPQEALADRIGSGCVIQGLQHLDATGLATRAKQAPNLLSLSRIRYLGACPYGVASRSCWATQASVGERVTPTWITLRDCSSMRKKAKSGRKNRSVTCKKSHAQTCAAWLRRKVAHFWPRGWWVRTVLMYF